MTGRDRITIARDTITRRWARFVSEDPLGMVDGPNLYKYVQNNPVSFVDPLGLTIWACARTANIRVVGLVGENIGICGMIRPKVLVARKEEAEDGATSSQRSVRLSRGIGARHTLGYMRVSRR